MSEKINNSGKCLCGAVQVNAKEMSNSIGACHCSMCRKWGGGPLLAVDCGSNVEFAGEENISVFTSSEWAERGFCNKCGSHLFYRLRETGQLIMPAGLFDNDEAFVFDHQVFIDHKPDYYSFSNTTKDMTEEEIFKKYSEC